MRNSLIQRFIPALAVACVAAITAVPASAATKVSVSPPDDDPRFGGPGTVGIDGDSRPNDVSVGFNPKREFLLVEDSKARIRTEDCVRLSKHSVRCNADPADHDVGVGTGSGDDRVHIRRAVPVATELRGDKGADVLVGGRSFDYVYGGTGNDRLKGRAGEDELIGGEGNDHERGGSGRDFMGFGELDRGVDSFRGGDGSDILSTEDGTMDARIQCGRGFGDYAFIDPAERPRVTSCPRIEQAP